MSEQILLKSQLLTTLIAASALMTFSEAQSSEHKLIGVTGDYYVFGLTSNETLSGKDSSAAGGIARVTIDWMAYQDEADLDTGLFKLRVDHKHDLLQPDWTLH
ncbi:hypothetical protein VTH8203_04692 [Vibrio thalassae]|uniref:Porin domain-containing protein n=1 Tax=Vibrio thalassae TaxID=1243014 RepID=A0A240ER17_9VIBR|nr:hypothetical protein [Vibrio thalassae]SNX51011.1 hypothetical protein VTH8203_04692 [Vibrio thalassae]